MIFTPTQSVIMVMVRRRRSSVIIMIVLRSCCELSVWLTAAQPIMIFLIIIVMIMITSRIRVTIRRSKIPNVLFISSAAVAIVTIVLPFSCSMVLIMLRLLLSF